MTAAARDGLQRFVKFVNNKPKNNRRSQSKRGSNVKSLLILSFYRVKICTQ